LLLAHSPNVMWRLGSQRADLVLAGHYHGGQVRTPWGPVFTNADPRLGDVRGLHMIDGTPVHMSAGLGSTFPFRLLCPPEMTMLHLVRGPLL
jgi:predicted MPP superfamily phosphohydrolase